MTWWLDWRFGLILLSSYPPVVIKCVFHDFPCVSRPCRQRRGVLLSMLLGPRSFDSAGKFPGGGRCGHVWAWIKIPAMSIVLVQTSIARVYQIHSHIHSYIVVSWCFFSWNNKFKWCEFQDVSSDKTALSQPGQVRSIDATKYFVFREAQNDFSERHSVGLLRNRKLQCQPVVFFRTCNVITYVFMAQFPNVYIYI